MQDFISISKIKSRVRQTVTQIKVVCPTLILQEAGCLWGIYSTVYTTVEQCNSHEFPVYWPIWLV